MTDQLRELQKEVADLSTRLKLYETGLNEDERWVVQSVADRLRKGRRQYGPWIPHGDERQFDTEANEEVLDALVYVTMKLRNHAKS